MKLNQQWRAIAVGILLVSCCGCTTRRVVVRTEPPGATITVTKKHCALDKVVTATTPVTLKLDRFRGSLRGQDYDLHIELAGYRPVDLEIQSVFLWRFAPNQISQTLTVEPTVSKAHRATNEWTVHPRE